MKNKWLKWWLMDSLNIPIESVPALPGCGLGLSGPVLNGELPSRQHGLFNHITIILYHSCSSRQSCSAPHCSLVFYCPKHFKCLVSTGNALIEIVIAMQRYFEVTIWIECKAQILHIISWFKIVQLSFMHHYWEQKEYWLYNTLYSI